MESKVRRLFIVLGGFFITNALLAEFIGVKIFSLERTFGFDPVNWHLLGIDLSFNLTAGALMWPFVFVLTDIINEYFGRKGVQLLSYLTICFILYAFLMVGVAMVVAPADFWIMKDMKNIHGEVTARVNMQIAFNAVFGQGMWIIIGSMTAFLIGQFVDVYVFHKLRRLTKGKGMWMRSTVSTLVSQLIDSFVVLYIAFYLGGGYDLKWVLAVMVINYIYKVVAAFAFIPIIYVMHRAIDKYLGHRLAHQLAEAAHRVKVKPAKSK